MVDYYVANNYGYSLNICLNHCNCLTVFLIHACCHAMLTNSCTSPQCSFFGTLFPRLCVIMACARRVLVLSLPANPLFGHTQPLPLELS